MIRIGRACLLLLTALASAQTFSHDVAPILQRHCVACHRAGEIGPMPLDTYAHVRPYAAAIREQTRLRRMPPWFADPCCGRFSNDPSLSPDEIETLARWVSAGARKGTTPVGLSVQLLPSGWHIPPPDVVFKMPHPKRIPASGDIAYQYLIFPTHFAEDRWVRASEILPSNLALVHHAVAYIRPPGSSWLRGSPVNRLFSSEELPLVDRWTDSDILLVYAPGSLPDQWPDGYAKLVPAGSDIILQMHYTGNGKAAEDTTSIGLVFAQAPPVKRVLTLQLTNDRFSIPPGEPAYRVESHGSLPHDAELLSLFPHMHLRGRSFEYNIVESHGRIRTLLRIPNYDFFWQLSYRLAKPVTLKAGTILQAVATFDNSKNNPHNPNPEVEVHWGEQTAAEMMVGFFDVAVDPAIDKARFFVR